MNTKTIPVLIVFLVAIGIGMASLFLREAGESGDSKDSAGLIIEENAIYVAEQTPSNIISVAVVRLEKPGFVLIHEDTNATPGKILGVSKLLLAGETKDFLQISLSRSTVDGETVYAMLHFDDGDGVFNTAKDGPVLDPVGNEPVMMIVVISKDATEPDAVIP